MHDGADFCEAVAPGDVTGEGQRVYQLLHDRFADGDTLTLPGVLAELAERGWDRERRWLTLADVELDPHLGSDPARLKRIFIEAAQAIRSQQRRQAIAADRRALATTSAAGEDSVAAALELAGKAARLAEQLQGEHNPGRIARGPT